MVSLNSLDTAEFELYNIAMDISEESDLSHQYPDKKKELMDLWFEYKEEVRILDL